MKNLFHVLYIAIIAVLVFLLFKSCNKKNPCETITGTTVTVTKDSGTIKPYTPTPSVVDTTWPANFQTEARTHLPVSRGTGSRIQPAKKDTSTGSRNGTAEEFTIIADEAVNPSLEYHTDHSVDPITFYKDSLTLPDSAGKVYVFDMIQHNTIAKRAWTYRLNTRVTTNTAEAIRRNKWFVGIEDIGNQTSPVKWIGGGVALMPSKERNLFTASAGPMNGSVFYKLGAFIKIGK